MNYIKIKDKFVGENQPCFIIAEAGVNHNGSLELAKKLIDVAVDAGVDAVKFQILTAKGLYVRNAGRAVTDTGKEVDAYKIWEDVEVPYTWIPELKRYCDERNVMFFSSVFDEKTVDILEPYVDFYKIASSETSHIPLLRKVAKTGKPIIISIGGATMEEVEEAVRTVKNEGNDNISLLYCVQKYPTPLELANVSALGTLTEKFPDVIVGYSDHSLDPDPAAVPVAAVVKDAKIIEKHFTLSREMEGIDHKMSLEPDELKQMVQEVRSTEEKMRNGESITIDEKLLGNGRIELTEEQVKTLQFVRRKIFAMKDIKQGETFTEENLAVLRPGNRGSEEGLHPREYLKILGKKVAKDRSYLEIIDEECIKNE